MATVQATQGQSFVKERNRFLMYLKKRILAARRAALIHFACSLVLACLIAGIVFGIWFPYPFGELAGGRELFTIIIVADVICGPLLTLVLYNPQKPRRELWMDMAVVVLIQISALAYGTWTVWQARPLYFVLEIDRFKVIAAPDLQQDFTTSISSNLRPRWLAGPLTVGIRPPRDEEERRQVMFESALGGRDYAERPEFYVQYTEDVARRSRERFKPLNQFLQKYPLQRDAASALAKTTDIGMPQLFYLPVIARQDWVVVLNEVGAIQGFLKGDGF